MKTARKWFTVVAGSVAYWLAAGALILFLSLVLPGDCGTEQHADGVATCLTEVRLVAGFTLAIMATIYLVRLVRFFWRNGSYTPSA